MVLLGAMAANTPCLIFLAFMLRNVAAEPVSRVDRVRRIGNLRRVSLPGDPELESWSDKLTFRAHPRSGHLANRA
jgi:hypothetical protein